MKAHMMAKTKVVARDASVPKMWSMRSICRLYLDI